MSAMWEEAIIAISAKGMTLASESIGYYSNSLFQCALKGQTEGDTKGDKDQQAGPSQREQRDQVLDEEAGEEHSITERRADGPREGKMMKQLQQLPPLQGLSSLMKTQNPECKAGDPPTRGVPSFWYTEATTADLKIINVKYSTVTIYGPPPVKYIVNIMLLCRPPRP